MVLIEPLIFWLLTRLRPTEVSRAGVAEPVALLAIGRCPTPLTYSALRRHVQSARFNRPPRRLPPGV